MFLGQLGLLTASLKNQVFVLLPVDLIFLIPFVLKDQTQSAKPSSRSNWFSLMVLVLPF